MKDIAQATSANVHVGPLINVSGSVMIGLSIANDAVVLIQEGGASSQRSDTTSAASIGPGVYRVVLNASDTATLGQLDVLVSGSGALPWRETVKIWYAPTHALFYGSADQIATSAGVSAIVSVVVNQGLTDYDVATSADVSAIVSAVVSGVLANYDVATSSDVSAIASVVVAQALSDYGTATSAGISAAISVVASNVAALALTNYGAATSAGISAAISVVASNVAALALTNYGAATSAGISAAISAVGSAVAAQALSDFAPLVSANTSAAIEAAVFQRAMTEPTGAPSWAGMNFDVAVEWVAARNTNRQHQASTSAALFNSANSQIASASVGIFSTSANQDQWL